MLRRKRCVGQDLNIRGTKFKRYTLVKTKINSQMHYIFKELFQTIIFSLTIFQPQKKIKNYSMKFKESKILYIEF